MKRLWGFIIALVGLALVILAVTQYLTHRTAGRKKTPALRPGEMVVFSDRNFQFRMPEGWERKTAPPSTAGMVASPAASDLESNMVTTSESYNGTLRAYVDANLAALPKLAPTAKVVNELPFQTHSQLAGRKLKLGNELKGKALAQFMYFFAGPEKKKIIVTCTTPASNAAQMEPLFDACMKTFALSEAAQPATGSPKP